MDYKQFFQLSNYKLNIQKYKELIKEDAYARSTFMGENGNLNKKQRKTIEFKIVKMYRLYQANYGTLWGKLIYRFCKPYIDKYGVEIFFNPNIGRGLVIGHWGRIVISGKAQLGNQVMLTHGVTIGRDIRGKRKGDPHIGNRVAIRANSTVTGNITIGDDVVIAPNTFVNFDVPSHSVVIGNPATVHHRNNASEGHVGSIPE